MTYKKTLPVINACYNYIILYRKLEKIRNFGVQVGLTLLQTRDFPLDWKLFFAAQLNVTVTGQNYFDNFFIQRKLSLDHLF